MAIWGQLDSILKVENGVVEVSEISKMLKACEE
jgi:hypothetical protein